MLDKLLIALVPFVPFVAIFMFLAKKARKQKLQEKQQGIIRLQDKQEEWEEIWSDDDSVSYSSPYRFSIADPYSDHSDYRSDDD